MDRTKCESLRELERKFVVARDAGDRAAMIDVLAAIRAVGLPELAAVIEAVQAEQRRAVGA